MVTVVASNVIVVPSNITKTVNRQLPSKHMLYYLCFYFMYVHPWISDRSQIAMKTD